MREKKRIYAEGIINEWKGVNPHASISLAEAGISLDWFLSAGGDHGGGI